MASNRVQRRSVTLRRRSSVDVRVIRHYWSPSVEESDCGFLLLTAEGQAIEASCSLEDSVMLIPILRLRGCYTLTGFIRISPTGIIPANPPAIAIRIGQSTEIRVLSNRGDIADSYFNVGEFNNIMRMMTDRMNRPGLHPPVITDYVGCVITRGTVEYVGNHRERLHLVLVNAANQRVPLTLRDDVLTPERRLAVDRRRFLDMTMPLIVAATSVEIKHTSPWTFELYSTAATHLYVNPLLRETADIEASLRAARLSGDAHVLPRAPYVGGKHSIIALLITPRSDSCANIYSVTAKIDSFISGRKWCRSLCIFCRRDVILEGAEWWCGRHGFMPRADHRFTVEARISDSTFHTTVTLDDHAMTAFYEQRCADLIDSCAWGSLFEVPDHIKVRAGGYRCFFLQAQFDQTKANTQFVCNRVDVPRVPGTTCPTSDPVVPAQVLLDHPMSNKRQPELFHSQMPANKITGVVINDVPEGGRAMPRPVIPEGKGKGKEIQHEEDEVQSTFVTKNPPKQSLYEPSSSKAGCSTSKNGSPVRWTLWPELCLQPITTDATQPHASLQVDAPAEIEVETGVPRTETSGNSQDETQCDDQTLKLFQ